ncbi:MAG: ABC transporter permease [Chitinophagaceae bacterium]|nr:ABC transporter permease [Chitinophagaceae bacterium]
MIKNYLKTAWRNLVKHRAHSFINLAGLSVGLACSLLILLWVQDELSVDAFHANGARLYKIYEREYYTTHIDGNYDTPGMLADELKKVFPEIEDAVSMEDSNTPVVLRAGSKTLKVDGSGVGASLFTMFSYPLLQGDPKTALISPLNMAISRRTAMQFFGSPEQAIGKTLRMNNQKDFIITAVFENFPAGTSRRFDYLISWSAWQEDHPWAKYWTSSGPLTYILLRPGANAADLDRKLAHLPDKYMTDQSAAYHIEWGMQKFDEVYLNSRFKDGRIAGGRIEYVRLFSIIAVFILLIACINFMNLSTARSIRRSREVGVRKVAGAMRSTLIRQFLGESLLLTSLAVGIALVLMILTLPLFNQVTQKQMILPFGAPGFWLKLSVITIITGIIAGSYPALFLSSFHPVKVLKGVARLTSGAVWFRKALVVFQFVISIVLVVGTIVVSQQVNFIQHRNLGYDREDLVYLPIEGTLAVKYRLFKDEALSMPGIQYVSSVSDNPSSLNSQTNEVDWDGRAPKTMISFESQRCEYDLVHTMQLQLKEGRDFSRDYASDSSGGCLINETAAREIGYTHAVGRRLSVNGRKLTIIGVLKDFHFRSLHEPIRPLVLQYGVKDYGNVLVRTRSGRTKEALHSLETLYRQLNPAFPFTYTFSDEAYQALYRNEQVVTRLSNAFSFLAIFISCLGLLGLVMFTAEQRTKEIGIRKVLGASVMGIVRLISADFLKLVIIAILLACPLAWWMMSRWLDNYAYRIDLNLWIFVLAGALAMLITLCTISFQSIRAALANPAASLKIE